jgi:hypothetical protein
MPRVGEHSDLIDLSQLFALLHFQLTELGFELLALIANTVQVGFAGIEPLLNIVN